MASIGRKLETKGVIAMTLLTLVLMNIGCEDKIDNPVVNPSEGKTVEVTLNIGFADEEAGTGANASPVSKTGNGSNRLPAFEVVPVADVSTKAMSNVPDKLYNLDIIQYTSKGTIKSNTIASQSIGADFSASVSLTTDTGSKLLLVARGNSSDFGSLSGKSLSAVQAMTVKAENSKINATPTDATGSGLADMPYYLLLENVTITSDGKIHSTQGYDARLLLKRLAVKMQLDWSISSSMKSAGYVLKEVKLCQAPAHYRLLPKTEATDKWGDVYPTSVAEFADVYRLTGAEIENGTTQTKTVWIPANARGISSYATSPLYRNKDNANPAATYAEFVVDNQNKKERLYYRAYLGGNETNDFNLLENKNYHWIVKINNANYTNDPRIQLLDQTQVISTNLQPTANCFMMRPGTSISFNPYKHEAEEDGYNNKLDGIWNPYLINNGSTIGDKKQIAKIKVLWQSKDNATSGDLVMGYAISKENHSNLANLTDAGDINNARIHVKVANTKGGNAVVAAYNSEDVIVWSWHLWVTDYVPQRRIAGMTYEQAQELTSNGSVHQYPTIAFTDPSGIYYNKVMMDRNLCAGEGGFPGKDAPSIDFTKRVGYLYYWGRKDPFFGLMDGTINEFDVLYDGDGYSISISKIAYSTIPLVNGNRMQYTIQNPSTIVTGALSWHDNNESSGAYRYLYANAKTLYDPCPFGWKISAKPAYEGFNTAKAYWFSNNGEFLQPGSDSEKGGRLYNLTEGTGVPTNITIHNTAWMPKTGYRHKDTGNLVISSGRGYLGTATMAVTSNAYRCYYSRFNASSIELVNGAGILGEPYPFRCVQK